LSDPVPHRRRLRYSGKYPRKFEEKYKELHPEKYPETIAKVLASGKTPAGSHVPIMVEEILEVLAPQPGETAVDATVGYGGHTEAILRRLQPGGLLLGLDADPIELPKTEARLQELALGTFRVRRTNFAGLPAALAAEGLVGTDCLLADLGVSSMQLDTPTRGFSTKLPGPLDMRMNPARGISAALLLQNITTEPLEMLLRENADEPHADTLATALAGRNFPLTTDLSQAIRKALPASPPEDQEKSVRRVFQAIRIAVNEEFTALDTLLRVLPACLNPGGRAAILTFHSGEDRRVKKAFQAGLRDGTFSLVARDVVRATAAECRTNPRASSAKLRWAVKASL
jgi:16S rRNA (cytosine1402-N4)-methyltransferase